MFDMMDFVWYSCGVLDAIDHGQGFAEELFVVRTRHISPWQSHENPLCGARGRTRIHILFQ
jgi:hypothetical protein